jgi:hypothetical protein
MKQVMTALLFVVATMFGSGSRLISAEATPIPTPTAEAASPQTQPAGSFADLVRQNTNQFQNLQAATDAGYALFPGCVSDSGGGAMGIHYVNGDLVGDGKIDAKHPEAMIYEESYGQLRLIAAEYIVLAKDWDANNPTPPVLMGQLFQYIGAPNRYGLPALYELHVWAWKNNPNGTFADWNPNVSCEEYTGGTMALGANE